ncbi:hypothetical protein AYO38_04245 [bacterium SCGC AG-212-C10]|nr:hypothetical protein AYO38_04245 [bacterium SCGC AG-212-C10]
MTMLNGVRVVETGEGLAAPFAGRMLASLGATVTRIEEPKGSPLAHAAPGSVQHALYHYLHEGKDILRPSDPPARAAAELAHAQIWLDSRPFGAIAADAASAEHRDGGRWPQLTHVAITPFGLDGPWAGHPGSAFVAASVGGLIYLCGESDREPLRNGGHLPEFQTGLFAALGAVAGLFSVELGQPGRLVDLSLLESVIAFQERGDLSVTHLGVDIQRSRRHEVTHPFTILPCKDGFISLATGTPRQWQNLCVLMGAPQWADDPEFLLNRLAHWQEIDEVLVPWLAQYTPMEATRICQEMLIACGPVLTATELLYDAHLAERNFYRSFGYEGQELRVPNLPIRTDGQPLTAEEPAHAAIGASS